MKTTPNTPGAFLRKLRADADGFANSLTGATYALAAVTVGWMVAAHLSLAPAVPAALIVVSFKMLVAYLVFRALAALIDYAIYATIRAFADVVQVTLKSAADVAGREAPSA